MVTLATTMPTLLDMARASDPDGRIAPVIEILNQTNEILDDMVWVEGNLPTGHRSTIRAGLPTPTWRKLYGGVQPTKGTTVQVTDSTGMLEAFAEVDKALADLNGNTGAFRTLQDRAHLEGMSQEMARALFYESEVTNPERITGFSPRFNDTSAANGENIILGGSAGGQTDNSSIWLIGWGPATVHGIIPKGSIAGMQRKDYGEVVIESIDGAGGRMVAYRTHYRWDTGLTVADWRYVVRIPNIDKSLLTSDYSTGANLNDLMLQAEAKLPSLAGIRPVFYMPRNVHTFLMRQTINTVKTSTLTMEDVQGRNKVLMFNGIPVRRVDALAADETRVA